MSSTPSRCAHLGMGRLDLKLPHRHPDARVEGVRAGRGRCEAETAQIGYERGDVATRVGGPDDAAEARSAVVVVELQVPSPVTAPPWFPAARPAVRRSRPPVHYLGYRAAISLRRTGAPSPGFAACRRVPEVGRR